jgi:hypothetical protein
VANVSLWVIMRKHILVCGVAQQGAAWPSRMWRGSEMAEMVWRRSISVRRGSAGCGVAQLVAVVTL